MPVFENSIGTTYFISAPETCDDKIENGDETDVDCGGIICLKCNNTRTCKNASDCMSGVCNSNRTCSGECLIRADVEECSHYQFDFEFYKVRGKSGLD